MYPVCKRLLRLRPVSATLPRYRGAGLELSQQSGDELKMKELWIRSG